MIEGLEVNDDSIKGIVTTYCVVAGLVTVFRLSARGPRKWWWDDLCTFVGLLAITLQTALLWLRFDQYPSLVRNKAAMLVTIYLNGLCFYIEDWGARCAILFSIIRITLNDRAKRYLKLLAFGFFILYCVNVALLIGTCEKNSKWHANDPPRCKISQSVPIFRIVTGILSDSLLVIIPIYNLKQLKSAPALRRTLFIIFGSSVWLAVACIGQAAVAIQFPGDPQLVASLTAGFIGLLLCNFSVVVITIINLCGCNRTIVNRGISGSFELTTGPYIQTIEESLGYAESLQVESSGSFKKLGESKSVPGARSFLARWREMDVDADNASRVAPNDFDIDNGAV